MSVNVTILDMQPIDPPIGGGRLRLLGLYHALGPGITARYVGTYDWPGQPARRRPLSESLEEILVPLSSKHFAAANAEAERVGGRGVIDLSFPSLAHLSPDYVDRAREATTLAEIVIFSHPWIYPLVADLLREDQLVVYDAHNMEGLLRMALLGGHAAGTKLVRCVVAVEVALCRRADLVLACSQADRDAFTRLYGVASDRTRLVPNGTFTSRIQPASVEAKAAARGALGLDGRKIAFFLGSNYGPNVEAAQFIVRMLVPAVPDVLFVIGGGVGEALIGDGEVDGLRITGILSEEERKRWLAAADVAVNPMFGGSGTNIKMFDFMSAGLPIVTTKAGARGIVRDSDVFTIAEPREFARTLQKILAEPAHARAIGEAGRALVERFYSWERISRDLGALLWRFRKGGAARPTVSVVIPTFARHASLGRLVGWLERQTFRDFEVIIIDQSVESWESADRKFDFPLYYVHTDVRGAVAARNRGADLARGKILAFTDDDCEPAPEWLAAGLAAFGCDHVVGVEGLITSDHFGEVGWRPVTNEGSEGVGFMTANLFVRASDFQALGGFDLDFEDPNFREDTDLGWRLQERGEVPFCQHAWVHHPAQRRSDERESIEARSRYFEKDALLLAKHPKRYLDLFFREAQWRHNPYFFYYLKRGAGRYGVTLPSSVRESMAEWAEQTERA